jgi:hypothetical protein
MKKVSMTISLALMGFLIGCAPAYIPNVVNVPLLSEKGEFQGLFCMGTSGTDVQASYGMMDNIGILANYSYYNGTLTSGNDTVDNTKRSIIEGGAGYYKVFKKNGRFEAYSGYGQGISTSNTFDLFGPQDLKATGHYRRFFFQPSIGTVSEIFDAALSLRTCYVNFYRIQCGDLILDHNVDGVFVEPLLTARIGYRHVKFFIQTGCSLPLGRYDGEMFVQPFLLNLGLSFNIGKSSVIEESK